MSKNLNNLTDKENHLLTQLAYYSHGIPMKDIPIKIEDLNNLDDSVISKDVYNQLIDAGFDELEITAINNDRETGFGAIAFKDSYNNTGISFRGTDMKELQDWGDNISTMILGTSKQSEQSLEFFNNNKDENGNNFLYGHSKGGELATSILVNNYLEIAQTHVLNPQPINPCKLTLDQKTVLNSSKYDVVVNEGDYVWFLGLNPYIDNIRFSNKVPGTNSHNQISVDYGSDGNIVISNKAPLNIFIGSNISTIIGLFQTPSSLFTFLNNQYNRIIDYVLNDMLEDAKKVISYLEGKVKEFINVAKDAWNTFVDNAKILYKSVTEWIYKTFNTGYKYATSNPIIKVDTHKLRNYADRLESVNRRLNSIDSRMNSLYWSVGFLDLFALLQADLFTDESLRLKRCISYLDHTASDFEKVERNIISRL